MADSLQFLFEAITQTQEEKQLREKVLARIGQYFAAKRWGLFFFEQTKPIKGIIKRALSVEYNPVVRYLVERHAPVHEQLLLSSQIWETICPYWDHGHVMAGPIVNNGRLIGVIGFTRYRGTSAFNEENLADLSALCLHLSTWLAARQPHKDEFHSSDASRLTARETQIASLVARGLTNAQIGAELWITENSVKQALKRMFRKLEVSTRAEMVAKIFSGYSRLIAQQQ